MGIEDFIIKKLNEDLSSKVEHDPLIKDIWKNIDFSKLELETEQIQYKNSIEDLNFIKNNPKEFLEKMKEKYNLKDWWEKEFTEQEKESIKNRLGHLPSFENYSLTLNLYDVQKLKSFKKDDFSEKFYQLQSEISSLKNAILQHFINYVQYFLKKEYLPIAIKIINKGEEFIDESTDVFRLHFFYLMKIRVYYKYRDVDPNALEVAIDACKKQIAIAPKTKKIFLKLWGLLPDHTGFQQLAIIEEKRSNYDEAIKVCMIALQQGWPGDWEKRIQRCLKKKNKT